MDHNSENDTRLLGSGLARHFGSPQLSYAEWPAVGLSFRKVELRVGASLQEGWLGTAAPAAVGASGNLAQVWDKSPMSAPSTGNHVNSPRDGAGSPCTRRNPTLPRLAR